MIGLSPHGGARDRGSRRAISALVIAVALSVPAVTGCTASAGPAIDGAPGAGTSVAAQPVLPTPIDTGPTREPARQLAPVPAAGTVTVEAGAFTDRLRITDVALQQGDRPRVTAQLSNAADVSELIVLEVRADFYSAAGTYLGSGRATYADDEFAATGSTPLPHGTGSHDGTFTIAVASDDPIPGAASAILTVPQLVNE